MQGALVFTHHANTMTHERMIQEAWVLATVENPDIVEDKNNSERHYMKRIPEKGMRVLRVIVNHTASPPKVITVFIDRRVHL